MFKPMLAHSKTPDFAKLTFPLIVQPKLDGIRASVVDGKLVSRSLKPIPNEEISAALSRPEFEGLDGEIIVGPANADDAFNRTTTFVRGRAKTGEPWVFHVFDKWDEQGGFWNRFQGAREAIFPAGVRRESADRLCIVESVNVLDMATLEKLEADYVAEGFEGAIARVPDAPYKFGRSGKYGPLLKIKRFIDFEAEIIGVYEEMHNGNEAKTNALGRTERSSHAGGKVGKGRLGGFELRALNGPHEGQEFRCGTGFNVEQRILYWTPQAGSDVPGDTVIDRTAKIKSFPIGVKDAPRFPVFLGFREDFDRG